MFENIILYFFLFLISFFPIVIWAYIFSYVDENPINKKRFYVGIIGGALSVVPILYMDKILELINIKYLNIFYFISKISSIFSSIEFSLSLSLFLIILVIFSIFFGGFINLFKKNLGIYVKNILVFFIFILFLSLGVYLSNFIFNKIDFEVSNGVQFGNILFNSFKLIVFYYLLVAFIEETSKHFNFLQSSILHINSVKNGVLYAIFIALGFGLVENILYLNSFYVQHGLTFSLLKIYFFRSVFSIIVHILCSSIVAYYFSKALILYREKNLSLPYLKIFSFGILLSILLHLIFDVALTLGFSFIMFIYFVGGYLYVSSIFYRE